MHKVTPAEEAYVRGYSFGLSNDKRGLAAKKQERGYSDDEYLQKELDRGFIHGELSRLTKELECDV